MLLYLKKNKVPIEVRSICISDDGTRITYVVVSTGKQKRTTVNNIEKIEPSPKK